MSPAYERGTKAQEEDEAMSKILLKVKGTGYGGLPSGTTKDNEADLDGNAEDRVYYRLYSGWGRGYEVRYAYMGVQMREAIGDHVGIRSEDECRTSAYFLVGNR